MVSPIFFIFLLLSVRLISCDALCHVVLEVLVEERVVVFAVVFVTTTPRARFTCASTPRSGTLPAARTEIVGKRCAAVMTMLHGVLMAIDIVRNFALPTAETTVISY